MSEEESPFLSGRLFNIASSVNILAATFPITSEVSFEIGADSGFIHPERSPAVGLS